MKPIECLLGAVAITVGSETYHFERDEHGRFVTEVENLVHRSCLLSVAHYREVEEEPPVPSSETEDDDTHDEHDGDTPDADTPDGTRAQQRGRGRRKR
ncbi:hypothetical protein [Shinella pollutisoli]|uniref:Uncharacterized protein n=1 Tax=Shinella pollutisoli TaxID=2250594 RepID=A0ABV7DIY0_9HYPH|nr:hypothetical protein [Shinella pollutisoli]